MRQKRNRTVTTPTHLALLVLILGSCVDRDGKSVIVPLQDDPGLELGIRLTFNDRTAWFMFDTGAGAHTLASWFVDAAGMAIDDSLVAGVQARDAVGAPVELRAVHEEMGRLPDGNFLVLESAIVTDFPPGFQQGEVGGLLNPQLLVRDGQAAVLDLRVPELRIEPFNDAVRRVGARPVADDQVRMCGEADAPIRNQVYAVLVMAGEGEAWLGLDTGAGRTSIVAGSPLIRGLRLEAGGLTMGIAGRPQVYSVVRNLAISFAGSRATVDAGVVETTSGGCGSDGNLGRDALARCALVFGRESLAIICDDDGTRP